jgi:hypothetical protein
VRGNHAPLLGRFRVWCHAIPVPVPDVLPAEGPLRLEKFLYTLDNGESRHWLRWPVDPGPPKKEWWERKLSLLIIGFAS